MLSLCSARAGGDSIKITVTCRRIRVKLSFLSGVFQNDIVGVAVVVVGAPRELGTSFSALVVATGCASFRFDSKVNVTADTQLFFREYALAACAFAFRPRPTGRQV